MIELSYDLVVIGGGISGICCAVAAAREGIKVALIQDRSVLGGNASSEIRMHICGADIHGRIPNARETGIIEEMLLTNRYYNEQHSFPMQDIIFYNFVKEQENLDLYLNTTALDCVTKDNKIISITAHQSSTEKDYTFYAKFFTDASGDGMIAYKSGAKYLFGRESKDMYNEPDAPDVADDKTMGSSIMFTTKDMGHPVPFTKPKNAYTFTEEDLKYRDHSHLDSGYWWLEVSGEHNTVTESDKIYDTLLNVLLGVWDHIKNNPEHHAENYALDWIGSVVGKRESRRFIGDYVLNENDLLNTTVFPDAVAYGGWNMDVHETHGVFAFDKEPTTYFHVDKLYGIPYRSLYSVNVDNLFLCGRSMSATHIAFGSTRVMGTCGVMGQAVGTAAALAVKHSLANAREVGEHIDELQQVLLKNDCYIPNVKNCDRCDSMRQATIFASEGEHPEVVTNGVSRNVGKDINYFEFNSENTVLSASWQKPIEINEVVLKFDSDLSKELTITISEEVRVRQQRFPKKLARDYSLSFYNGGKIVKELHFENNLLRHCDIRFDGVYADRMELKVHSTHGGEKARIFEIRTYNK